MAQVKATFYLPVEDNDGRELRSEIRLSDTASSSCLSAGRFWVTSSARS